MPNSEITTTAIDSIEYASVFTGNLSFLLAILVGVAATYFVFRSAHKMGGGLFGLVLKYVGLGMVFIVLGASVVFLKSFFENPWFGLAETTLFVLGFVFLVLGSKKLLKGITFN